MNNSGRRIILIGFAGLVLIGLAAVMFLTQTDLALAQGGGGNGGNQKTPTGNNSYCAICHSQPGRVMTLPDGSVLNLYVSPSTVADSVHGTNNPTGALGCVDCHGENVFPHNGPSPESERAYRVKASEVCSTCHNQLLKDSAHLEQIAAGNLNAATCVDCHGAHDVPRVEDQPTLASAVCANCHTDTVNQWAQSPHAQMSALGCAVCHLPHGQQLRIENTNQLCLNCHKVPSEIYIHSIHLTGAKLTVSCASCHMGVVPTITLASDGTITQTEPQTAPSNTQSGQSQPTGTESVQTTPGPTPTAAQTGTTEVVVARTDHHMIVQAVSCNQCHEELEHSGAWSQLVGTDQQLVIERDALRNQVATLESNVSERNQSTKNEKTDYVQLIQGLIVGVGLGLAVLVIVVSRLRSGRANTDNGEES